MQENNSCETKSYYNMRTCSKLKGDKPAKLKKRIKKNIVLNVEKTYPLFS